VDRLALGLDDVVARLEARLVGGVFGATVSTVQPVENWSASRNVIPSIPAFIVTGFSAVPALSLGTTLSTSSNGTAKPMPTSYHSNPDVSSSLVGEIGTMTPITRPSMARSGPP